MSTDRVKSEEFSKEGRTSAPIDLLDASLEEMLFLEGIGEVSARKIISIRETGIPLPWIFWGEYRILASNVCKR